VVTEAPSHDLRDLVFLVVGKMIVEPLLGFAFRLRIRRHHAYDGRASCVVACNHRSFADPPLATVALRRPLSYFARGDLWRYPVIGFALRFFGGIPVARDAPRLETMKTAVAWLRRGARLLVFPEGTRTRDGRLGRLREGPALFARRAGVPVVPVYLHRSELLWPRGGLPRCHGRVTIRVGRPVPVPDHLRGRDRDRFVTLYLQRWMRRQEALLRGYR